MWTALLYRARTLSALPRGALALVCGDRIEDALSLAIDAIQFLPRVLQQNRVVATGEQGCLALGDDLIQSGEAIAVPCISWLLVMDSWTSCISLLPPNANREARQLWRLGLR